MQSMKLKHITQKTIIHMTELVSKRREGVYWATSQVPCYSDTNHDVNQGL